MEEKLRGIIAEVLEIDACDLSASTDISTFDMWDSIAHVRIIAEIEDVLNVSVPIDRALKFRSIRDFIEAIAQ